MAVHVKTVGQDRDNLRAIEAALRDDRDLIFVGESDDLRSLEDAEIAVINLDRLSSKDRSQLRFLGLFDDVVVICTSSDARLLKQFSGRPAALLQEPLTTKELGTAFASAKSAVLLKRLESLSCLFAAYCHGVEPDRTHMVSISAAPAQLPPPNEIEWIEAEGNYLKIHTETDCKTIRMTMEQAERALRDTSIVRGHRQWMVNLDKVEPLPIGEDGILKLSLRNGPTLTASRAHRNEIEERVLASPLTLPLAAD